MSLAMSAWDLREMDAHCGNVGAALLCALIVLHIVFHLVAQLHLHVCFQRVRV